MSESHHYEPDFSHAERRQVRAILSYFHSKGTTMAKTLDDLQKESVDLKAGVDAFAKNMTAQITDLKAQIAALKPDPDAQAKIDATFANMADALAEIAPPAPPPA